MAEYPEEPLHSIDKETAGVAPGHHDVETGDQGILVHAAPLARKLKGRHMQMIAIGKHFTLRIYSIILRPRLTIVSPRRCNWSWVIRRLWKCFGYGRTW
jgi:hypothetical protein